MNRHIKQIEISDFRGFEGTKTLDFEDANLILFLGLNGFGKTSIFDAVEWCLTGKLGRYETYLEGGRKQDFGKEKEVLRNKYATQPNTFVKVHLSDGKKFGRRILSNDNEPDYNTGSIVDDFEFGPGSICREQVAADLINNYFSATHLLSQETIHHFVTSKKPEDRYRSLSVNFGTALFTPFEGNIQNLLNLIENKEGKIKSEITSIETFLREWKDQEKGKTESIEKLISNANVLVEKLNKIIERQQFSTFSLQNHAVELDEGIEELIRKLLRDTNQELARNEQKAKAATYLSKEYERWTKSNSDLKAFEDDVDAARKALLYVQDLAKELHKVKLDIKAISDSREKSTAQKNKIGFISDSVTHYLNSLKVISSKEEEITKLLQQHESDRKAAPALRERMSKLQSDIDSKSAEHLSLTQLKSEIVSSESVVKNYAKQSEDLREAVDKCNTEIKDLKNKGERIDAYFKLIEKCDLSKSSLLEITTLQGANEFLGDETIGGFAGFIKTLDAIHLERVSLEDKKVAIEKSRESELMTLSARRKLVADSLALIDRNSSDCECPVCKTGFQTQALISALEQELSESSSRKLSEITSSHASVVGDLEKNSQSLSNAKQAISDFLKKTSVKTQNEKSKNNESLGKRQNFLNESISKLESLDTSFNTLMAKIAAVIDEPDHSFEKILEQIDNLITRQQELLSLLKGEAEQLNKDVGIISGRMDESQKQSKQASDEIEKLKDTLFKEVHTFLIESGISPTDKELRKKLNEMLAFSESEISGQNGELDKLTKSLKEIEDKLNVLPKDQTEKELLKRQSELRTKIDALKEEIKGYFEKCEQIGISPGEYKVKTLDKVQKEISKSTEVLNLKSELYQSLVGHMEQFRKFNENRSVRQRIEEYQAKIQDLEKQKSNLKKAKDSGAKLRREFPKALKELLVENLDVELFNKIYKSLSPHRRFEIIDFDVDVNRNRVGIHFNAKHSKISARPEFLFSSAQLNTFGICMFLSMALRQNWLDLDSILIDDPIQNLDDINVLSFIDFIRGLLDSQTRAKQIILSTHDERFYDLMIRKFQGYKVKAFKFESYGKIVQDPMTRSAVLN